MALARLVGKTKVELGSVTTPFGDELTRGFKVTIGLGEGGDQLSPWEIHERLKVFRMKMESMNLKVHQVSGVELHGYAETRRRI